MPMVTPTLNLPVSATPAKVAPPAPAAAIAAPPLPPPPSAMVTLSQQALSAMASGSHPPSPAPASSPANPAATAATAAPAHDDSVYDALKNGISTAFTDVGDAISSGAHAVVDGVENTLSMANKVAKGIVELPFAAVSRAADAAGALIDEL